MQISDELWAVVTQGKLPLKGDEPDYEFADLIMHDHDGIMMSTDKEEIEERFRFLRKNELQTYSIKKVKLVEIPA